MKLNRKQEWIIGVSLVILMVYPIKNFWDGTTKRLSESRMASVFERLRKDVDFQKLPEDEKTRVVNSLAIMRGTEPVSSEALQSAYSSGGNPFEPLRPYSGTQEVQLIVFISGISAILCWLLRD